MPAKFLVIDDNPDSRFLLVKTLLRKFPAAVIQECENADSAINLARAGDLSAIVTHRATEMSGFELVRELRTASPATPIIMVSSIDRTDSALEAGANAFLLYDEWLRVGTVVASLLPGAALETGASQPPFAASSDAQAAPA